MIKAANTLFNRLSTSDLRELLIGTFAGIFIKVIAAALALGMNIAIVRSVGAEEAGLFYLGLTIVTVLAAVGRLGLDGSVVRFVARANVQDNLAEAHAIFHKAAAWCFYGCVLITIITLMLRTPLAEVVFSLEGFESVLLIMLLALPFLGLFTLTGEALKGVKQVAKSMIMLSVVVPSVLVIAAIVFPLQSAVQTAWIYLGACVLAVILGLYWWRGAVPRPEVRVVFPSRSLRASAIPLLGVALFQQASTWGSQLILAAWSSAADVAVFAVAQRAALLTSFILVAVNAIAAPKFSEMYSQNNFEGLRHVAIWSVRLMLLAAVPALLVMLIFAEWFMGLFGPEFISAHHILVILALGQFVNVATGSVGFLLAMTGREKHFRFNVMIGAIFGVGLGLILIPPFGITGAAVATAIAISVQNLLGVFQVKRHLGFNTMAVWQRI